MNSPKNLPSRRTAVKSAIAVGAACATNQLLADDTKPKDDEGTMLQPNDVVLFQGDSITDAGRSRKNKKPNNSASLGNGYAMMIAAKLLADHPKHKLQIHNRGVSGNRVDELHKRWQADCFDLKPNLLSILIGVNDIWHKLNGNYKGTVETYAKGLADLLQKTRDQLPETKIVICEPFVLRCGAINDKWFPEFDHRRAACKKVADEFKCIWIPFQSMFDKATNDKTPPAYWGADGVHPSLAGHALMAKTWIDGVLDS